MKDFYLYRYSFNPVAVQPGLFAEARHPSPLEDLARVMDGSEMKFYRTRRGGQTYSYRNSISSHGGVSLMRLQNSKSVTIADPDFTQHTEGSFPYVSVIVDHRPGRQIMAIEKSAAFGKRRGDHNSTQAVAALVAEAVSNHLEADGWTMLLTPVARRGELWSDVHRRVVAQGKRVRSIEYRFPATDDSNTQKDTAWYMMMNFARRTGASNGVFRTLYERGDAAEMESAEGDIRAMEVWASRERYEINVQFDDMETLRAGTMLYAHRELPERDIDDFIQGARALDGEFVLLRRLDEIYGSIEGYEGN